MKNVIMVHGYNGIPKVFEWLKKELIQKGYLVVVPKFPTQEGVIYNVWRKIFDDYKNDINERTIIIAHSIGNEFIIKYLADHNININMYISLAGFADIFENEGKEDLNRAVKEFLVTKEEVEKFNKLVCKEYSIYSDNDHIVPLEVLEEYPKILGAKSILIKGIGHLGKKSGLENLPKVLEIIDENYH